jgi:hypothetical protein
MEGKQGSGDIVTVYAKENDSISQNEFQRSYLQFFEF